MQKVYVVFQSRKKDSDKFIGIFSTQETALQIQAASAKRYVILMCIDVEYEDAFGLSEVH